MVYGRSRWDRGIYIIIYTTVSTCCGTKCRFTSDTVHANAYLFVCRAYDYDDSVRPADAHAVPAHHPHFAERVMLQGGGLEVLDMPVRLWVLPFETGGRGGGSFSCRPQRRPTGPSAAGGRD